VSGVAGLLVGNPLDILKVRRIKILDISCGIGFRAKRILV